MRKVLALLGLVLLVMPACEKTQTQTVSVTMTRRWTAPSGDGALRVQRVRAYEAKWATDTTALKNNWAAQETWTGIGVKSPAAPGTAESYTFSDDYPYGRVFFAIKSVDSAGNWSDISNFWDTTFVDVTKPEKVSDLR